MNTGKKSLLTGNRVAIMNTYKNKILNAFGRSFKNFSIRNKLFTSSIVLSLFIIISLHLLSQNLFSRLMVQQQIEYDMNYFGQVHYYFNTLFENTESFVQQIYDNSIVSGYITEPFDKNNFSDIKNILESLDTELDKFGAATTHINKVFILGLNDLSYIYDIRQNEGQYMEYNFSFEDFMDNTGFIDDTALSKPFFFKNEHTDMGNDSINNLLSLLDNEIIHVTRLKKDNAITGMIIILLDKNNIINFFNSTIYQQNVFLISNQNKLVASSSTQSSSELDNILSSLDKTTGYFIERYGNEDFLYTFDNLSPYNFTLLSKTPVEHVFYKDEKLLLYTLIYSVFCILSTLIISYVFSKKISNPVKELALNLPVDLGSINNYSDFSPKIFVQKINIKNKIIYYFILTVIFTNSLFTLLTIYTNYNIYRDKITDLTGSIIKQVKYNIDYKFKNYDEIIQGLMYSEAFQDILKNHSHPEKSSINYSTVEKFLFNLKMTKKDFLSINLYNDLGKNIYPHNSTVLNPAISISKELLSDMKKTTGELIFIGTQKDIYMNSVIYIGRKIYKSLNNPIAYMICSIDQSIFNNVYQQINLGDSGYFSLMDKSGNMFNNPKRKLTESLVEENTSFYNLLNRPKGIAELTYSQKGKKNSQEYLLIYDTLDSFDLKIIGIMPSYEIKSKLYPIIIYGIVFLLIYSIIILFISLFISSSITRPLKKLQKLMKEVKNENFDIYMEYDKKDEIYILSKHFNNMIKRLKELIYENYQAKLRESELKFLEKEAQFYALQQQINPHFLYNTLESIKWMAYKNGSTGIFDMTTALGNFLKDSISKNNNLILIESELSHLENYIYIQKIRYSERLEIKWQIEDEIKKYKTIKLILQPIVENSITHGIDSLEDGGCITIKGYKLDGKIQFEIIDNGIGIKKEALIYLKDNITNPDSSKKSSSIGITNVYRRLNMYFNEEFVFEINSIEGKGTTIKLSFPAVSQ